MLLLLMLLLLALLLLGGVAVLCAQVRGSSRGCNDGIFEFQGVCAGSHSVW